MTHATSAEAREVIRYKDLTAELIREGYKYKWYCPQTQTSTYISTNYSFDEVLERGQIWLIQLFNYWSKKQGGETI